MDRPRCRPDDEGLTMTFLGRHQDLALRDGCGVRRSAQATEALPPSTAPAEDDPSRTRTGAHRRDKTDAGPPGQSVG